MAQQRSTFTDLDENGKVGDWYFVEGDTHLIVLLPCGESEHGETAALPLRPATPEHPSWEWNGNRDKPTLSPSILHRGVCAWHGYLRDGVLVVA